MLKNDPGAHPLDPGYADQTGSVTSHKVDANMNLVQKGEMSMGDALQESARGTAKDINTKLEPLIAVRGASPAAAERINEVKEFLNDVGKGKYMPSEAQALAEQKFGTNIQGLAGQVDSNIAAVIKAPTAPHITGISGAVAAGGRVAQRPRRYFNGSRRRSARHAKRDGCAQSAAGRAVTTPAAPGWWLAFGAGYRRIRR